MATEWISPTWRMPNDKNQSKFENYSLDTSGTSEGINVGSMADLFGTALVTYNTSYSIWIKPEFDYNTGTYQTFFGNLTSGDDAVLLYYQTASDKWRFLVGDGSGFNYIESTVITSNEELGKGNWQHHCVVFDTVNNNAYYYINNQQVNTSTSLPKKISTNADFYIGKKWDLTSGAWVGELTQACIFNYALSTNQRNYLYNSGTPQNPMAISGQPPIAYYPLGGSSTGSSSTLTIPNESVPSATVFDFNNSETINCGYLDFLSNATKATFSFWAKKESSIALNQIFGVQSSSSDRMGFVIPSSNQAAFYINSVGSTINNFIPSEGWYHIVIVWDASESTALDRVKIYLNNSATSCGDAGNPSSFSAMNADFQLGQFSTQYLTGQLSNFQIWDTSLSSTEVATLYNNGVPLLSGTQPEEANLRAWYKLNVDTSTWDGADWIIGEAQANYSSALNFVNSENDSVDVADSSSLKIQEQITICAWVNLDNYSSYTNIIDKQWDGADRSYLFRVYSNKPQFLLANASGSSWTTVNSSSTLDYNEWYFLSAVYDGSEMKIYINGIADGTPVSKTDNISPNNSALSIGNASLYTHGWNGMLSNVMLFNTGLSQSDITTLYNNGNPVTDLSSFSSAVSWWKLNNLTTGIQDSAGSNNGTNNGATVTDIQVSTLNGTSDGMTTANLVNSDLTRSIPYSSYSMEFDGVDDEINFSSTNDLGLNNTVSMWVNLDSGYSGALLGESSYGSTGYFLLPYATGFFVRIGATSASATNVHTYLTAGSWHNLTVVRNAGNFLFYVDGAFIETVALSSTTTTKFDIIGNSHTGADPIEGNISNVCGFNSILTEDQILTIYNGGVPNDISSLSPTGWWSLADDSYFNGTDWICPDLGSGGNNGTSSGMGGSELVGDAPGGSANGIATNMDIPTNLKGDAPNSSSNAFSVNMDSQDRVASVPS